jgi:hypothetical protein
LPPKKTTPSKASRLGFPVTELRLEVRTPADLAKLSRVRALKGSIHVPFDTRLHEVDIGGVVELTRHSAMLIDGPVDAVIGRKLQWAGSISTGNRFSGRIVLPALRYVWYAGFVLPSENPVLELPALEETLNFSIQITSSPFTVRLPKLAKGKVEFLAHGVDPDESFIGSTFEMPLLPPENLKVGGHPNVVRRIHALAAGQR